jgi:hypothetical protein
MMDQLQLFASISSPGALVYHDGGEAAYNTRWDKWVRSGLVIPPYYCDTSFPMSLGLRNAGVLQEKEKHCLGKLNATTAFASDRCPTNKKPKGLMVVAHPDDKIIRETEPRRHGS